MAKEEKVKEYSPDEIVELCEAALEALEACESALPQLHGRTGHVQSIIQSVIESNTEPETETKSKKNKSK